DRPFEPGEVRDERGIARARPSRDAGEHIGTVGHLRYPLGADERGHLDHWQSGRGQPVDELDLVRGGYQRALVLQSVSRADFDDRDAARRHVSSARTASAGTSWPSWQLTDTTVASAGARTGSSIFIASSSTTTSPFFTRSPAWTCTFSTVAGIGAVSAPAAD